MQKIVLSFVCTICMIGTSIASVNINVFNSIADEC
jgi:hypothetical protein